MLGFSDLNQFGNSFASPKAIGSGASRFPPKAKRNVRRGATSTLPFHSRRIDGILRVAYPEKAPT